MKEKECRGIRWRIKGVNMEGDEREKKRGQGKRRGERKMARGEEKEMDKVNWTEGRKDTARGGKRKWKI